MDPTLFLSISWWRVAVQSFIVSHHICNIYILSENVLACEIITAKQNKNSPLSHCVKNFHITWKSRFSASYPIPQWKLRTLFSYHSVVRFPEISSAILHDQVHHQMDKNNSESFKYFRFIALPVDVCEDCCSHSDYIVGDSYMGRHWRVNSILICGSLQHIWSCYK